MKNLRITVNGVSYDVQVEEMGESSAPVVSSAPVAAAPAPAPAPAKKAAAPAQAGGEAITAPMPGTIVSVNVTAGKAVKKGEVVVVLEAMKMENEIMAPRDGVIASVSVNKGDSVESGATLVSLQ